MLSLSWCSDEEELRKSFSELGEEREDTDSRGTVVPSSGAFLYKMGFLVRKFHADCDGKRSRFHYLLQFYFEFFIFN